MPRLPCRQAAGLCGLKHRQSPIYRRPGRHDTVRGAAAGVVRRYGIACRRNGRDVFDAGDVEDAPVCRLYRFILWCDGQIARWPHEAPFAIIGLNHGQDTGNTGLAQRFIMGRFLLLLYIVIAHLREKDGAGGNSRPVFMEGRARMCASLMGRFFRHFMG